MVQVHWKVTLRLAFQSLGMIYGDVGTSPLYVFSSTFPDGIDHTDDVLGVLSLIIYTIILLPMIKYVFIVLSANDHGGGTWSISLNCSLVTKLVIVCVYISSSYTCLKQTRISHFCACLNFNGNVCVHFQVLVLKYAYIISLCLFLSV